ncbi:MAG TPA: hypothetical protein VK845_14340 [Gemmatimonadales bacterium]|nr:hypothetical protein [Gemmatimonadales bacterium]
MPERRRGDRRELYARVHALYSKQYREIDPHRWYRLSPQGLTPDGHFWIVDYGVKVYASRKHFEIVDRRPDPSIAS